MNTGIDAIVVGGFSPYVAQNSMAFDQPFLLHSGNTFCDVPGLYKTLIDPGLNYQESNIDAPPYVCYAIKQMLFEKGYSCEMVFYLDFEKQRMADILDIPHTAVLLSSTFLVTKSQLRQAAAIIRSISPDSIIICGGPFIDRSWAVRNQYLNEKNELYEPCKNDHLFMLDIADDACGIDLFIIGDHSLSIAADVLDSLKKGRSISAIVKSTNNCAMCDGNGWEFSSTVSSDMPILPAIHWDLFRNDEIRMTIPMLRSKGCPFKCQFCNFQRLSKYQEKGTASLMNEIEQCRTKFPDLAKYIYFCDDNFCGNPNSMKEFLDEYTKIGAPFYWYSMLDARFIDDYLGEKLKKTHCFLIKIGMESADDAVLENMGKPCRFHHYKKAINACVKSAISVDGFFFVGFPGESENTVKNTIENLNTFDIPDESSNQFVFFVFMLAPLSPVFERERRERFGLSGYMSEWRHSTMNNEIAQKLVPEIVKNVHTMEPVHGSIEKMLLKNGKALSAIDKMRGRIIRESLKGTDTTPYWEQLKQYVHTLQIRKDSFGRPIEFY
jgi:radical SAM superfamily enzyme YgiQ (UPF0313 family)